MEYNVWVIRRELKYWWDLVLVRHWEMMAHIQCPQALNVWVGKVGTSILVSFFIEGSLRGEKYLKLPKTMIYHRVMYGFNRMARHPIRLVQCVIIWTKHCHIRLIDIEWPASSPDLISLDFFYLKSKSYFNRPTNKERNERRRISKNNPSIISNVLRDFQYHIGYC